MLPSKAEAEKELQIAGELNPGPWTQHSINTGIAARNIAEKSLIWIQIGHISLVFCTTSADV